MLKSSAFSTISLLAAIIVFVIVGLHVLPAAWTIHVGWFGLALFAGSIAPTVWPETWPWQTTK